MKIKDEKFWLKVRKEPSERDMEVNRARIRARLFGAALDSHEDGAKPKWAVPLQVGLGYGITAYSNHPNPPETVEVSADEFDEFIHEDRDKINPDLDITTRIGAVQYDGPKPVKFFIKKETYDAAKGTRPKF